MIPLDLSLPTKPVNLLLKLDFTYSVVPSLYKMPSMCNCKRKLLKKDSRNHKWALLQSSAKHKSTIASVIRTVKQSKPNLPHKECVRSVHKVHNYKHRRKTQKRHQTKQSIHWRQRAKLRRWYHERKWQFAPERKEK